MIYYIIISLLLGILKNKITYPPPLTDKNIKNRLREKLSDYNPPQIPRKTSVGSNEGVRSGTEANSIIIKPPQSALNRMTVELGTSPVTMADEDFDSEWVWGQMLIIRNYLITFWL